MKICFDEYLYNNSINLDSLNLSDELKRDLSTYFDKYDIQPAQLLTPGKYSDEEIRDKIDRIILRNYTIRFHNIGDNPYQRFYTYGGHYEWLKTLHYIISQVYYYAKEFKNHELCTNVGNRKIAIDLGYISDNETDKDAIEKAKRKVTDSLRILKDMNLITVEHIHNPGKRGSRHTIRLNWLRVIELFTETDYNKTGTIRVRKTIRYRILSFIKGAKRKLSASLRKLLKKQEVSYLNNVVTFNLERFQEEKFLIFKVLASDTFKYMTLPKRLSTDLIIPSLNKNHTELVLKVKDELTYNELKAANKFLVHDFSTKYNINIALVPAF